MKPPYINDCMRSFPSLAYQITCILDGLLHYPAIIITFSLTVCETKGPNA